MNSIKATGEFSVNLGDGEWLIIRFHDVVGREIIERYHDESGCIWSGAWLLSRKSDSMFRQLHQPIGCYTNPAIEICC